MGREALLESQDGSRDTSEWMGGVERPIQMVGGLEALPKGPGGVRISSRWLRGVARGQKALLEDWEGLLEVWEWSGGTEGVGRASHKFKSCWEGWEGF